MGVKTYVAAVHAYIMYVGIAKNEPSIRYNRNHKVLSLNSLKIVLVSYNTCQCLIIGIKGIIG